MDCTYATLTKSIITYCNPIFQEFFILFFIFTLISD